MAAVGDRRCRIKTIKSVVSDRGACDDVDEVVARNCIYN